MSTVWRERAREAGKDIFSLPFYLLSSFSYSTDRMYRSCLSRTTLGRLLDVPKYVWLGLCFEYLYVQEQTTIHFWVWVEVMLPLVCRHLKAGLQFETLVHSDHNASCTGQTEILWPKWPQFCLQNALTLTNNVNTKQCFPSNNPTCVQTIFFLSICHYTMDNNEFTDLHFICAKTKS